MTFYASATISQVSTVLDVCNASTRFDLMATRFIDESLDPDLVEVLSDILADAGTTDSKVISQSAARLLDEQRFQADYGSTALVTARQVAVVAAERVADALQGIEDAPQLQVAVHSDRDATSLLVRGGGLDIDIL